MLPLTRRVRNDVYKTGGKTRGRAPTHRRDNGTGLEEIPETSNDLDVIDSSNNPFQSYDIIWPIRLKAVSQLNRVLGFSQERKFTAGLTWAHLLITPGDSNFIFSLALWVLQMERTRQQTHSPLFPGTTTLAVQIWNYEWGWINGHFQQLSRILIYRLERSYASLKCSVWVTFVLVPFLVLKISRRINFRVYRSFVHVTSSVQTGQILRKGSKGPPPLIMRRRRSTSNQFPFVSSREHSWLHESFADTGKRLRYTERTVQHIKSQPTSSFDEEHVQRWSAWEVAENCQNKTLGGSCWVLERQTVLFLKQFPYPGISSHKTSGVRTC